MTEPIPTSPRPRVQAKRHRIATADPRLTLRTCTPSTGVVVVSADGEIDLANRDALAAALSPTAADLATRLLVCDLSDTTFLACSGLAVLLDARARLVARGAAMRLVTTDPTVLRVLDATGQRAVLDVRPDLASALHSRPESGLAALGAELELAVQQTSELAAAWGRLAERVSALDPDRLVDRRGAHLEPRKTLAEMAEDLRVLQNHLATGVLLAAPAVEDIVHLRATDA